MSSASLYIAPSLYKDFVACFDGFVRMQRPSLLSDRLEDRRRRAERMRNHIEADDYFGTLATVVDLLLQEEKKLVRLRYPLSLSKDSPQVDGKNNKLLENIRDDLMFLQKHYKIEKK